MMDAPAFDIYTHVSPFRAIALSAQARIRAARVRNPEATVIMLSRMEWGVVRDAMRGHRIAEKPQTATVPVQLFDDVPVTLEPRDWLIVEAALSMF